MGATLPLLTKYVVKNEQQIGPRVGLLYATNTVGAVGGTVVAGFVLLPALGLNGTVWVGVAVNLLVFIIAALLAQGLSLEEAAALGVQIHAVSGDRAAEGGERGLIATDLIANIRGIINP